jgi:hypothetical protein
LQNPPKERIATPNFFFDFFFDAKERREGNSPLKSFTASGALLAPADLRRLLGH